MLLPALFVLLFLASSASAQSIYDPRGGQQLSPPPSTATPEQRCLVSGRLTNALTGEAVKKAALKLTVRNAAANTRNRAEQGYTAMSTSDGSFQFENVEPGLYTLVASRNGYLNGQYGAKGPGRPAAELILAPAQQLINLAFPLTPQSVITGKVVDDDGDPVNEAPVQALGSRWIRGKVHYMLAGTAETNDIGEFRLADMAPGRYYISVSAPPSFASFAQLPPASGKPDIRPVRTFYPEATAFENATPLEIKAGQDLPGIDIRLHSAQTYHIRGKVVSAAPDKEDNFAVSLQPRDDSDFFWGRDPGRMKKDHTFDIAGVAPGSYTLNVNSFGGRIRNLARQPVDVGAADVNDLVISLALIGSVRGQLRIDGSPSPGSLALQNLHISLGPEELGGVFNGSGFADVKDDGSFTMENVPPGRYFVNLTPPAGTYLASLRVGSQELAGKPVEISQGGAANIQVVFRYGVAQVNGIVQSADDASKPIAGATVALQSESDITDGSGLHIVTSAVDGSFTVKQLPPGRYRAYAFEDADSNSLQNPNVLKQLENRSLEIELKENDRRPIQLTPVPSDQFRQILVQLGVPAP